MTIVLVVVLLGGWIVLPLPVAVAVGRAFRAGEVADAPVVSSRVPAA